MSRFSSNARRGTAGLILMTSMVVHATNAPDTLERSAEVSRLADNSMLAAIDLAGSRIVAVGIKGHVLLSDDQGESWRQASQVPVSVTLTDVCFNNDSDGWAVGHRGVILRSTDGGENWTLQYDGFKAANDLLAALKTAGSENAFYGELMVEDGADKPFLAISCLDAEKAVAVGAYGFGFSTRDGGSNWLPSAAVFDGTGQMHVYGIEPMGDRLLLAGERGLLVSVERDLSDPEQVRSPYEGTFFGIQQTGATDLALYGLRGNAYWSEDGGVSWQASDIGASQNLNASLELANGHHLLVDNAGMGWLTRDGGRTFQPVTADRSFPLTDLLQMPDGDVLATGASGFARFDASQLQ